MCAWKRERHTIILQNAVCSAWSTRMKNESDSKCAGVGFAVEHVHDNIVTPVNSGFHFGHSIQQINQGMKEKTSDKKWETTGKQRQNERLIYNIYANNVVDEIIVFFFSSLFMVIYGMRLICEHEMKW